MSNIDVVLLCVIAVFVVAFLVFVGVLTVLPMIERFRAHETHDNQ